MRLFFSFIIMIIVIFPNIRAFAEPEIKGRPKELIEYLKSPPDTVVISADAKFEVRADRAVAMLSVITEDESLKNSLVQNQKIRNDIIDKLKKTGIFTDRITGTKFSSTPEYSIFGELIYSASLQVEFIVNRDD